MTTGTRGYRGAVAGVVQRFACRCRIAARMWVRREAQEAFEEKVRSFARDRLALATKRSIGLCEM